MGTRHRHRRATPSAPASRPIRAPARTPARDRVRRAVRDARTEPASRASAAAELSARRLDGWTGRSLSPSVRTVVEPEVQGDLSGVRIHADAGADALTRRFRARALAYGSNVVFAAGEYAPHTPEGRRLLAHELTHVADQRRRGQPALQLKSRASEVEEHLGFFDSAEDAEKGVDLLESMSDRDLNDTLQAMAKDGSVGGLLHRLGTRARVVRFLNLLADRGEAATRRAVFDAVPMLNLSPENSLIVFGRPHAAKLGAPLAAPTAAERATVGGPGQPFSGAGARSGSQADAPISLSQMWELRSQGKEAEANLAGGVSAAKYRRIPGYEMLYDWSNPIKGALVGPGGYTGSLTPTQRQRQAALLLKRRISTRYPGAYSGSLPNRGQVVRAAAGASRLEPELVGAIILAEQRDQSRREDAVDYQSARLAGRQSSVGLGQVLPRTAQRHDLFRDLLSSGMRKTVSGGSSVAHGLTVSLLASDEFNIFAVARYLRYLADLGATKSLAAMPNTKSWVPGITLSDYAKHSKHWTHEHVKLIGSEYTSAPFDDKLVHGWGEFVLQAYKDVKAAGLL